jgi:hypothetical protein
MSKFKVFQINLTDEEIDTINAADDHGAVPKNVLRMKIDMPFGELHIKPLVAKEALELLATTTHVANITADGLEGVFHVGNMGPEENIQRFHPMHSAECW